MLYGNLLSTLNHNILSKNISKKLVGLNTLPADNLKEGRDSSLKINSGGTIMKQIVKAETILRTGKKELEPFHTYIAKKYADEDKHDMFLDILMDCILNR